MFPHGNRKMDAVCNPRGMTLVELAIVLAIFSVCSVLTIGILIKTYEVVTSVSEERELYSEGQNALKRITVEVQDAQSATLAGQTGIRIVKSHPASDGYSQVYFYKDGSTLYRKGEPSGTPKQLAQRVSAFTVASDEVSSNIYTIRLTLQDSSGKQYQFRTDVFPMNVQTASLKSFYNTSASSGDWAPVISGY